MMNSMHMDVCAVIRTSGERTEALTTYSLQQNGIDRDRIFYVRNMRPFSNALDAGYSRALQEGYRYTFFVDADMVLLRGVLQPMYETFLRLPPSTFFMNPLAYDFLTGTIAPNGPHLYKTAFLMEAKHYLATERETTRPETAVAKRMHHAGYRTAYFEMPTALHEFLQWRRHIVARVCAKYQKSKTGRAALETRLAHNADTNDDCAVAYQALTALTHLRQNATRTEGEFDAFFQSLQIPEKEAIENVSDTYDSLIHDVEAYTHFTPYTYTDQLLELQTRNQPLHVRLLKRLSIL